MNRFTMFLLAMICAMAGTISLSAQSPFTPVNPTGISNTIILPVVSNSTGGPLFTTASFSLQAGDEIGVFTASGLCVGKVAWPSTPANLTITVVGANTPSPGLANAETMLFRVWTSTNNTVYTVGTSQYNPNGTASGTGNFASSGLFEQFHRLTTFANFSPLPSVTFSLSPTDNVCVGSNITLTANITGGATPFQVLFESRSATTGAVFSSVFAPIQSSTLNSTPTSASITVPYTEQTIYRLTVTSSGVATRIESNIIQPGIVPAPVIAGSSSICVNTTDTYQVTAVSGNTYNWSVQSGGAITSGAGTNAIGVNWTSVGTHTIRVTQGSIHGCTTTTTFTVTVNAVPSSVITGLNAVCEQTTAQYSVPLTAGSTYSWSVVGGTITSGQNTTTITVVWNTVGAGNVSVLETNTANCSATAVRAVTVNALPTPVITGGATACSNQTSTYNVTAITGHSYAWTVNGGTIQGAATGASISVVWGNAGVGTVAVTQTSNQGCVRSSSQNITINQTPAPAISGSAEACQSGIGFVYSVANTGGSTFVWTVTGGTITSGQNSNQITVNWGTANPAAQVSVIESNSGCSATTSLTVSVTAPSGFVISGTTAVITGDIRTYSAPSYPGSTYAWTVNGGTITSGVNTNQITVQWGAVGTGTVLVTSNSTTCGSISSPVVNVTISPLPQPSLAIPAANQTGVLTSATLQWTSVSAATSYHVQIATEASFSAPVYNQSGIVATTVTPPAGTLVANRIYHWRVASSTATASSGFTPANVFSTLGGPVETMFLTIKGRLQGYWNTNTHVPTAVMVELWQDDGTFAPNTFVAPNFTSRVARATGVMTTDVSTTTGTVTFGFANVASGSYWVVLRHGGNLSVMSSAKVTINDNATTTYSFSNGNSFSIAPDFGIPAEGVRQVSGVWLITSGDLNASGDVNVQDVNIISAPGGTNGESSSSVPPRN